MASEARKVEHVTDQASDTQRELRELRETVQTLSAVVGRFVVVLERQLASNDAVSEKSRKALARMHPDMSRIQADVRAKLAGRKQTR